MAVTRASRDKSLRKPAGDYHHGNLRRAILDAAIAIIIERGAEGFTLREAARRIGVDHRAAYRHFDDRDAVIAAVAEEGYRALVLAVKDALARENKHDPASRVGAIGRAYVTFALTEPARYRVMTGPRSNESGRFPDLEIPISEAFEIVHSEIKKGIDDGVFEKADVREATAGMWAALHGLAILIIMRRVRVRSSEQAAFVDRSMTRFLRGLVKR